MDRSKANHTVTWYHEAISICENGLCDDAYNQKGQDTAIPAQTLKSCVHGLAAPDLVCTAKGRPRSKCTFKDHIVSK